MSQSVDADAQLGQGVVMPTLGLLAFLFLTLVAYVLLPAVFATTMVHHINKHITRLSLSVLIAETLIVLMLICFASVVLSGIVLAFVNNI